MTATPARGGIARGGFEWAKLFWALTLLIWISLYSWKTYDRLCSKPVEESPQETSAVVDEAGPAESSTLPKPGEVTLPAFDPNWKGFTHTKIKVPKIKSNLDGNNN